jgi:hypothetical protein
MKNSCFFSAFPDSSRFEFKNNIYKIKTGLLGQLSEDYIFPTLLGPDKA